MKQIKAIVQPFLKDKVLTALQQVEGLPGITVSEVIGCGKPHTGEPDEPDEPDAEAGHVLVAKTKIEIFVTDELVEIVVDTITQSARTGRLGDGKIFVSDVLEVVKIRTGERGSDAI